MTVNDRRMNDDGFKAGSHGQLMSHGVGSYTVTVMKRMAALITEKD